MRLVCCRVTKQVTDRPSKLPLVPKLRLGTRSPDSPPRTSGLLAWQVEVLFVRAGFYLESKFGLGVVLGRQGFDFHLHLRAVLGGVDFLLTDDLGYADPHFHFSQ